MATTAAKPKRKTAARRADPGVVERLQRAVRDAERLAERASGEARTELEELSQRIRDIAGDLRQRAETERTQLERTLEDATEDARREIGRRAVRAQRTPEALSELTTDIRRRRAQLNREAKAADGGRRTQRA